MTVLLLAVYAAASAALLVYGANCYVLVVLFLRGHRRRTVEGAIIVTRERGRFDEARGLPHVATQIPLYNEANVAERAIRAAAAIEYPAELHEIQVLDDSDDETLRIVDQVAAELRERGHKISVLRRSDRRGFKAGALALALTRTEAEFVAIFDADFVPPRDFLHRTLPFFLADARVGIVQARWDHLNAGDSPLTQAQAIGIDGHFMVEQSARTFNGLFMNFNGTAGIWRRQAIIAAGGWSADTLTEDLDLSYRAQLAGWRTHFTWELGVPGELPASLSAFKSQQFRWAKGSIQTARKLLGPIVRSEASAWAKAQAALHLTHYAIHPFMLVVALLAWPVMVNFPLDLPTKWVVALAALLAFVVLAPNAIYLASQRALHRDWWWRLRWLPVLTCLGIGLAVNNARAVLAGLFGPTGEFVRTPKRGGSSRERYRAAQAVAPWTEFAVGLYCAASLASYLGTGRYAIGLFLMFYTAGFISVGAYGLIEHYRARRAPDWVLGEAAAEEA